MLEGVIGRTHQRASFDVFEAHSFAEDFEFCKFVRMDIADDGQMFARGLQILA